MIDGKPMTPNLGFEIEDLNVSLMKEDDFADLAALLDEHKLLFIHNQDLSRREYRVFADGVCTKLGAKVELEGKEKHTSDVEGVKVLENDGTRPIVGGERFHSDSSEYEQPPRGAFLYSDVIPSVGGDTLYMDSAAAFASLSPMMQEYLTSCEAEHQYRPSAEGVLPPSVLHPMVIVHPRTGRKCLYVNALFTKRIAGVSAEESAAVLGFLFDHVKRPELQCRLYWRAGSIAIWDNLAVQHYAVGGYSGLRRLWRIQFLGQEGAPPLQRA